SAMQLVMFRLDTNESRVLIDDLPQSDRPDQDYVIGVSPDDQMIAVAVAYNTADSNPIYLVRADGSAPTIIPANAATYAPLLWSPDSSMLVYTSGGDSLGILHVVNRDGMEIRQFVVYPWIDTFRWTDCD